MIVLKWNFANSELCYKLILFELILYLIYNIIYNIKSINIQNIWYGRNVYEQWI